MNPTMLGVCHTQSTLCFLHEKVFRIRVLANRCGTPLSDDAAMKHATEVFTSPVACLSGQTLFPAPSRCAARVVIGCCQRSRSYGYVLRERERDRDRDRQTDRDRERERQRERQRERDRETERERQRQRQRQSQSQSQRETDRQSRDRETETETERQTE